MNRKKFKNKKGLIFNIVIGLAAIAIMVGALIVFLNSEQNALSQSLGTAQYSLINDSIASEKSIFYIQQKSKNYLPSAILNLGRNGGFSSESPCGKAQDLLGIEYNLWNDRIGNFCFPDYLNSLEFLMNQKIDSSPNPYGAILPKNNYRISLSDNSQKLLFLPKNPSNITSSPEKKYSYLPSFSLNLEYPINSFVSLAEDAKKITQDCRGKTSEEIDDYLTTNYPNWGYYSDNENEDFEKRKNYIFLVTEPFAISFALYLDMDISSEIPDTKESGQGLPQYSGSGPGNLVDIDTSLIPCSARICKVGQNTYIALLYASSIAKEKGYTIKVNSAYRSAETQIATFIRNGCNRVMACGPTLSSGSCDMSNPIVSNPSSYVHCPHVSMGAADITISELDMGPWNAASSDSWTQQQLDNHQILQDIMCEAGFVRYINEWWHFEYGTTRWENGKSEGVCAT